MAMTRLGAARIGDADRAALAAIKTWMRARFGLREDEVVSASEMACSAPGCPPVETVILFWPEDGRRRFIKLFKRARDVAEADLPPRWMKDALFPRRGRGLLLEDRLWRMTSEPSAILQKHGFLAKGSPPILRPGASTWNSACSRTASGRTPARPNAMRRTSPRSCSPTSSAFATSTSANIMARRPISAASTRSPRPTFLMCKAAALTKRIRMGAAVKLIHLHHPVDVAIQAAVTDHLLGQGRYIFGFGTGFAAPLFSQERGLSFEDRHERLAESLRCDPEMLVERRAVQLRGQALARRGGDRRAQAPRRPRRPWRPRPPPNR